MPSSKIYFAKLFVKTFLLFVLMHLRFIAQTSGALKLIKLGSIAHELNCQLRSVYEIAMQSLIIIS